MDLASLRFSIDVGDVAKAEDALDRLAQSGDKAEQAAKDLSQSWTSVGQSSAYAATNTKQTADAFKSTASAINSTKAAIGGVDASLNKAGVSAGQTANALRQLPAQFTDIFTSLASGQAPLTVLIQQGGQIKDSFGGVGNALRETALYARTLVNPLTLAAAAAAALALAYKQGSEEADAFNKAIITTGNAAGTTANELADIARQVDGVVGTQAKAADVLAQLASTGKIAADQFELLTTAAVAYEQATGQAVEDSIEQYKRLAEEPVEAALKLNETLNFLTPAIYDQIVALEEQGRTAEAAAVAQKALATEQQARADELIDNLGYIESAWRSVTSVAKEAWDAMLDVGRSDDGFKLQQLEERLKTLQEQGERTGRARFGIGVDTDTVKEVQAQIDAIKNKQAAEKEAAELEAKTAADNKKYFNEQEENRKKKEQAEKDFANLVQSNLTKEQKLTAEIAKIRSTGAAAGVGKDEIEAQVRAAEARFAESLPKGRTARAPVFRDDAATKLLASLREQEAALNLQLTTTDKLTKAEQDRVKFEQQITDLKTKGQLTAEQQSLLNNQDAIRAQLDKNVAIEQEVTLRQKAADEAQKLEAFEGVLADNMQRARDSLALALEGVGRGDKVQKQLQEQLKIQQDFANEQSRLQEQFNRGDISQDLYDKETQALARALDERLQLQQEYYVKDAAARGDWLNGVTKSFEDYVDAANDVSGQTEQLFTKALGGIEDEFVSLATTGKASFRGLADAILTDIARIGARSLISNAIGSFGFGGGSQSQGIDFGSIASAIGSFFGGGRATGGSVSAGKFYEVGEGNKPELLMAGGKQYLIPGNNGAVVPNGKMGGTNNITVNLSGISDRREAREAAATAGRQITRAVNAAARFS